MRNIEELHRRFGDPQQYHANFLESLYYQQRLKLADIKRNFKLLSSKNKMNCTYENSRQHFLKLLSEHKMVWYPTNADLDLGVEVSRIYRDDKTEYVAFMRIQPRGFRAERVVPNNVHMVFHILIGNVVFMHRRRIRVLTKGHSISLSGKSDYSIRCLNEDQPAYLIFRIVDKL